MKSSIHIPWPPCRIMPSSDVDRRMLLPVSAGTERRSRQSLVPPIDDDPLSIEPPLPELPTDVPVPTPQDVPVPEPRDVPAREPHDVPAWEPTDVPAPAPADPRPVP
jgi:hypothetical protein